MGFEFLYEKSQLFLQRQRMEASRKRSEMLSARCVISQSIEIATRYITKIYLGHKIFSDFFDKIDDEKQLYADLGYDADNDLFCVKIKTDSHGYRVYKSKTSFWFKISRGTALDFLQIESNYKKTFNIIQNSLSFKKREIIFGIDRDNVATEITKNSRLTEKQKKLKTVKIIERNNPENLKKFLSDLKFTPTKAN